MIWNFSVKKSNTFNGFSSHTIKASTKRCRQKLYYKKIKKQQIPYIKKGQNICPFFTTNIDFLIMEQRLSP